MPEWKDEDLGRSAPFLFCLNMKKLFTLIFACFIPFNAILAEITWTLSDDGTLTISGTDMPDYYSTNNLPWFTQRSKIKKVVIKSGVTNIGRAAFAFYDSNLTSVTIPNSVTSIGYGAFGGCSGINSITIPNSVTSIGSLAFSGCSGLTSITIPNSVTSIGENAFSGCSNITSADISMELYNRISYIFPNLTSITVTIPDGATIIGSKTFYGDTHLTSVKIPNSVSSIGNEAFFGCSGLTSITIPSSVTSIGEKAFSGCTGLNSVTIPNSVTSIGYQAFYNCSGITSITIPNSVTSIRSSAFSGCSGITSITIPNSVTSIGSSAFSGCSALASITIPSTMTGIGSNAFAGTSWYNNQPDGLVYAGKVLYKYKGTMPSNTKIDIKEGTTCIAASAFKGCSDLTSLTIPNSVTNIGGSAFSGCSGLTSIIIPNSVTSIGYTAFYGAKLRNIVIKAKTPPSGGRAFSDQSYYHTTLMIPEGSWDAYAYAYDDDNWYRFINIREMTYNEANLTNSKAYMLKSSNEGSYLFYDSVNDCVASLNETALDDTEENNTWMTTEVDGKHYVYNLGAKKFLVADKTNAKTGYRLSDVPASIDIEDGKDAIVFGKSKEFYMVINDKLNVDENLESQIIATTGIKGISVEANKPTVTYSVNGQVVPNDTKGLHIKNGKKVIVKKSVSVNEEPRRGDI